VAIDVLANDLDIDGDPLVPELLTAPSHGSAVWNADTRRFVYTPATDYHGPDSFGYRVSDGALASAEVFVTLDIVPVDDAVTPIEDSATTAEDTPVAIDVLANDDNPDGRPVTPVLWTPASHFSAVWDSAASVSTPRRPTGTAPTASPIGSWTAQLYSPAAAVILTVTPVNDAPWPATITRDGRRKTRPSPTAPPWATITDDRRRRPAPRAHRGSELRQRWNFDTRRAGTLGPVGPLSPTRPTPDWHGTDSFTYRVFDGLALLRPRNRDPGRSTPVNDAPVAAMDAYTTDDRRRARRRRGCAGQRQRCGRRRADVPVLVTRASSHGSLDLLRRRAGALGWALHLHAGYRLATASTASPTGPTTTRLYSNVVTVTLTVPRSTTPPRSATTPPRLRGHTARLWQRPRQRHATSEGDALGRRAGRAARASACSPCWRNGQYTYTPATPDWNGTVTFTYTGLRRQRLLQRRDRDPDPAAGQHAPVARADSAATDTRWRSMRWPTTTTSTATRCGRCSGRRRATVNAVWDGATQRFVYTPAPDWYGSDSFGA
jgi:hypothetical protein